MALLKFKMTTIQLKKELINSISTIEDIDFLKAIKTIIAHSKKESKIELSISQEKELMYASKEGKKGKFKTQIEIDQNVEKWLKEK